jgi:molybdenum cofactor cytidylyltransferase
MITAIVLAAGQSKRMGRPKMLLPWGGITVLGKVLETLQMANITDILVITGGEREQVESIAAQYAVRSNFNKEYAENDMLGSIQCGLRTLTSTLPTSEDQNEGALICLGDQPQIQEKTVLLVCQTFLKTGSNLVVPSYQMRRGHPWLVARPLWDRLLSLEPPRSPRDFLNVYTQEIEYVNIDSPSVVQDLDTPGDYLKFKP